MAEECGVSRETLPLLQCFAARVEQWNPRINLVSRHSLSDLWTRHILDSAQLFAFRKPEARHWVDLGSGGGFPGIVIAILARIEMPEMRISLVESDGRKAAFLQTVAQELDLHAAIHVKRAEALPPLGADMLSARALAPLPRLLGLADRHLASDGRALFPKGAQHDKEVASSLASWRFNLQKVPSRTDRTAAILLIEGITRV